jgi:hypothetical protein
MTGGDDPMLEFEGDSDAHIVRGLVAIMLALFSGKRASAILRTDADVLPRGETTYQCLIARGYRRARSPLHETRTFDAIALEALQSRQRTAR